MDKLSPFQLNLDLTVECGLLVSLTFLMNELILMSNYDLILLFTAGIFLIALLTFIVLLIEKI